MPEPEVVFIAKPYFEYPGDRFFPETPFEGGDLLWPYIRKEFIALSEENIQFKDEITRLRAENKSLKKKVAVLEQNSEIELRDITREKAKKEIEAFFKEHDGETIYPSDVMFALGLDHYLVSEICQELEKEGKIKAL
jgi:hypothetical protein